MQDYSKQQECYHHYLVLDFSTLRRAARSIHEGMSHRSRHHSVEGLAIVSLSLIHI